MSVLSPGRLAGCAGTFSGISFLSPDPVVGVQQNRFQHINVKHMPQQKLRLHKANKTTVVCSML